MKKKERAARVFLMPYDASDWNIFHIKNNQLIILFTIYFINIIIFNFSFESRNGEKSSSLMTAGSESESWYRH